MSSGGAFGASGGSGLVGLADRLAAVGGRLVVDSRPGGGTTLRGLLPVHGRG
jgi:signal transduction histidine kinase